MEPARSNLEPIDDGDLNLEEKFTGVSHSNHPKRMEMPVHEAAPVMVEKEKAVEISASEKDAAYGNILSKVQTTQTDFDQQAIASDAQAGAKKTDSDSQIQHLIDIAQQKGVPYAVKVARHMEDYYLLDTLHDRMLAQELHDALLAKGLIKEI